MLANTPNILQMCSFDASKSTKGASKLRRDLINAEIANLRDLLPLPSSTRQRLSQLQLMALVCVYVRKANYFQNAFRKHDLTPEAPIPHFGFSKALSGFSMMMTQNGKLLYISDNAAEYLGHSMEDLLIHGDSVYDIIEKQDHQTIQAELMRTPNPMSLAPDQRLFLCRMNVSRNARRQMRFGDQKVVLVQGHFVSFLPLCSRNEPVFLATCTPVAMPETRECVVQGSTSVFTSIHSMDMRFMHLDRNGEFHLGYTRSAIQGLSWYDLVHWENLREAQSKHRLITQSEQERSCILLLRLETQSHNWVWVHVVLQVKENNDTSQQPVIVCTNQILSEKEAAVMRANNWLYQFYSLHSKMHYGLAYDAHPSRISTYYSPAAPTVMTHGYHSSSATSGPEAAPVPLHSVPYHPIHPAITPLNGTPAHHHPYHPTPVLQYSPQAASLPHTSFVPVTAPPVTESESNRQATAQLATKRAHATPSPTSASQASGHDSQQSGQQDPQDSESPEPNAKRVNHGHHLPPPPSSTYHHPRASTFGYPTTLFGAGGFSSMSPELGTVVPASGYYSGHQVLTSVPYHPAQIGHHFRAQNKSSLFDYDAETSDIEPSLTPNLTEDVSNMISLGHSPSNFFKYSPSALTLSNQCYPIPAQNLDFDKYSRKSPQSTTSDYGSGTSSPPSAFEKPRKENGLEAIDSFLLTNNGNIGAQMYQSLRNWNNYPIYTDLSSSKTSKVKDSLQSFKSRASDVYESHRFVTSFIETCPSLSNMAADSRVLYPFSSNLDNFELNNPILVHNQPDVVNGVQTLGLSISQPVSEKSSPSSSSSSSSLSSSSSSSSSISGSSSISSSHLHPSNALSVSSSLVPSSSPSALNSRHSTISRSVQATSKSSSSPLNSIDLNQPGSCSVGRASGYGCGISSAGPLRHIVRNQTGPSNGER